MHEGEHGIIDDAEHELASKFGHPKKGRGHDHEHHHGHHHHDHSHEHGRAHDHDHPHTHGGHDHHEHLHAREARKSGVAKVVAGAAVATLAGLFLYLRFL